MNEAVLIVFLKWPEPGRVKTRLIPALGPDGAASLYRALAEHTLERTAHGSYARRIYFAPGDALAEMRNWLPHEDLSEQRGEDLGARMAEAFGAAFRDGATRVAIIGSDLPAISTQRVARAFALLEHDDVVIGPTRDGGYYLLALNGAQPTLFDGIRWGEANVYGSTLDKAQALGLRVGHLPTARDIDTADDLHAVWTEIDDPLGDSALRDAIGAALDRDNLSRKTRRHDTTSASAAAEDVVTQSEFVLTLVGKPDCSLCDAMRRVVQEVLPHEGAALIERDVQSEPELMERYGTDIPVLLAGEREIVRHRTDVEDLRRRLARMGYGSPT